MLDSENDPCVFVVDRDKLFLDSLVASLKDLDFCVRGFECPKGFLRDYHSEIPGCLVLDVDMPQRRGLQMYERLLREGKRVPVIFITADAEVSTVVSAMKCGAIEFLEKPFDCDTLVNRVRQALELDAEWRRQDAYYAMIAERMSQLSDRERETLSLIQAGKSNKSMACHLFISERAVEMRRSAIMKKMQVNSVAELLDLAITHRILTEQRANLR